ncbi:hypothetical protein ACCO44_05995 [Microbacterium maritypicum]|uniref:hypothetical protein n=1 Tax=Microbacterium maritypicum TaxID=33918 RepID=UPI003558E874
MEDEPSTRESSDPDYQRLWKMSFRELAEIETDPENPLHEKAKEVAREVIAPMRPLFEIHPGWNLTTHFDSGFAKPVDFGLGKWATESLTDFVSTLPKSAINPATGIPMIYRTAKGELTATGSAEVSVDLAADEAPAETAAEVQDAVQLAANQYLERLVDLQTAQRDLQSDQLSHQKDEAEKSGEREKSGRRIAWATLIVAVVTLLVSVILGLPGFLDNLAS